MVFRVAGWHDALEIANACRLAQLIVRADGHVHVDGYVEVFLPCGVLYAYPPKIPSRWAQNLADKAEYGPVGILQERGVVAGNIGAGCARSIVRYQGVVKRCISMEAPWVLCPPVFVVLWAIGIVVKRQPLRVVAAYVGGGVQDNRSDVCCVVVVAILTNPSLPDPVSL